MLKPEHLALFVELLKEAQNRGIYADTRPFAQLLSCEKDGLTESDFFCLCKSMKIAAVAGDIPITAANVAEYKRAFSRVWVESAKIGPQAKFVSPFDQNALSHENQLLFPADGDKVLILPRSLAAAAAATFLIELVWKRLDRKRADKVVGDVFERVVALSCQGKAENVFPNIEYAKGNDRYQIDVATKSGNDVHLFEIKAKALKKSARSGDTVEFLIDYADSYLSILKQLVRHECHFRAEIDMSPLSVSSPEDCAVTKIAISPLSYGPVGDKVLAQGIVDSLSRAILTPIIPNPRSDKALANLSSVAQEILTYIDKLAVRKNGSIDLHTYMIGVFWLDIGELVYMLGRATSVQSALAPLKHLTFSSRDIWTEIANADRSKLTAKYWRPLAT